MKRTHPIGANVSLLLLLAALPFCPCAASPFSLVSESEQLTAVNAKEFNGYVRSRVADGSFKTETYAFGDGGSVPPLAVNGLVVSDPTIDGLPFDEIARKIAVPLADQNYVPSHDPKATGLLIMVYWGRSIGAQDLGELDGYNASLLGFDQKNVFELDFSPGLDRSFRSSLIEQSRYDLLSALRVDRYFVILRAFDFQSAWKQKKLTLLWETRFSLSERRHDFGKDLPAMAQTAALYFGQDSHGLVRVPPVPEGHVRIGEVRTLDDLADDESPGARSGLAGDWQGVIPGARPVVLHVDTSGNTTFESKQQHATLPAHLAVNAESVTMTVPGWDVLFRGTISGDQIKGTLSQYGSGGELILTRIQGDHPDAGATPEK